MASIMKRKKDENIDTISQLINEEMKKIIAEDNGVEEEEMETLTLHHLKIAQDLIQEETDLNEYMEFEKLLL